MKPVEIRAVMMRMRRQMMRVLNDEWDDDVVSTCVCRQQWRQTQYQQLDSDDNHDDDLDDVGHLAAAHQLREPLSVQQTHTHTDRLTVTLPPTQLYLLYTQSVF